MSVPPLVNAILFVTEYFENIIVTEGSILMFVDYSWPIFLAILYSQSSDANFLSHPESPMRGIESAFSRKRFVEAVQFFSGKNVCNCFCRRWSSSHVDKVPKLIKKNTNILWAAIWFYKLQVYCTEQWRLFPDLISMSSYLLPSHLCPFL